MRFELGRIVSTYAIPSFIPDRPLLEALRRHASGDWGECCAEDVAENDAALEHGGRILSIYRFGRIKFLIVTNRERTVTTIMLPEDF